MYCAYTIPGVSGGSFMYYYNGKAPEIMCSPIDLSEEVRVVRRPPTFPG